MYDVYTGKDCTKRFCESQKVHALEIIYFERKKINLLAKKQQQSYRNAKICYICKEKFENKDLKDKKNQRSLHYTGGIEVLRIVYLV